MNTSMRIKVLLFVSALCLVARPQPVWGAKPGGGGGGGGGGYMYSLIRVAYPGATRTEAFRLNDRANVAGTYYDADNSPSGFYFDRASGAYSSLGLGTSAWGINQHDAIVGRDELLGCGLYWADSTAEPIVLPPLAGDSDSDAREVNDSGIILGDSSDASGNDTPVVWYVGGDGVVGPVSLPLLTGHATGRAEDLTEEAAGLTLVVGTSGDSNQQQPVAWTVTIMVTSEEIGLTVTGPAPFEGTYLGGEAWGVNNFGDAVGNTWFPENPEGTPVLWFAGQPLASLPMIRYAFSGVANSINDAGEIVGTQFIQRPRSTAEPRAVLWTNSTTVVDLSSQVDLGNGETLEFAFDINHRIPRGDILARIHQGSATCLLIAK